MLRYFLDANSLELAELNKRLNRETVECERAHQELQTLFENIREVFFSLEMPGNRLLQMSTTCEQIYGYTVSDFELNPKLWFDVILDQDKHIVEANFPLVDAGLVVSQEYRIQHRNGEIRWLESRITPTLDINGQTVRIDGVTKDITEKKEVIEKLKKTHSHLLASQRIAHIGSWEIEFLKSGSLRRFEHFWTDETYRIFGYEPGQVEVDDDLFISHVHPHDRALVRVEVRKAMERHSDYTFEHRIITCDDKQKIVRVRARFEFDTATGAPLRMIGTIQDVTAEKRHEREREAITNDLLKQKQHLEQFAYLVSHNLRAPVANIIGFTELISAEETDPETMKKLFTGLSATVRKLDDIIVDLDQILQATQGLMERQEKVMLEDVVREVKLTAEAEMMREGVRIITDFSGADHMVTVKSRLHSIFLNLIHNSLKCNDRSTPAVIRIRSARKKNGKVSLIFSDSNVASGIKGINGSGLGFYKRFEKGIEGKGTSLLMVMKQVESLNGTIHVYNESGAGTEIVIEFES